MYKLLIGIHCVAEKQKHQLLYAQLEPVICEGYRYVNQNKYERYYGPGRERAQQL